VLIDTSGSMAADGLYDRVRSTLGQFLAGTTAVDLWPSTPSTTSSRRAT
jgi:hypothetical protein